MRNWFILPAFAGWAALAILAEYLMLGPLHFQGFVGTLLLYQHPFYNLTSGIVFSVMMGIGLLFACLIFGNDEEMDEESNLANIFA